MKTKHLAFVMITWATVLFAGLAQAAPAPQSADQLVLAMVEAIRQSTPAWTDDFETLLVADFWVEDEDEGSARFIADGAYNISIFMPEQVVWSLAGELIYEEFLLEADTQWVAGSPNNEIGFVFRYVDGDNFYAYTISSDGYYSLSRQVAGDWEILVDWTETMAIDTTAGGWNHLSLLVDADEISLLVNNQVLETIQDDQSVAGSIGLLAGAYDEDGTQIGFDNFVVWDRQNLFVLEEGPTVTPTPLAKPLTEPLREPRAEAAGDLWSQIEAVWQNGPLLHEDFRWDDGTWSVMNSENSTRFLQGRSYHIRIDAVNWTSWGGMNDVLELEDFLFEVEAERVSGPLANEIGVLFRLLDADNFYYYKVSSDGYYGLDKMLDGEWQTLIDWTETTTIDIDADTPILLGIWANGPQLTLLVNETIVSTYEDAEFATGDIALAAGTFDEGGVEIAFDDLYIWSLNPPPVLPTAMASIPTPILPTVTVNQPTPTPLAPTATPPLPTATNIAALPAADQLLAALRVEEPIFSDEFRRTDSGWQLFTTDEASVAYADRALQIQVTKPQWWAIAFNEQLPQLAGTDFLLEVDTQHLSGPTNTGYGIVFGFHDAQNHHRFFIAQNGYYALQKFAEGVAQDLIPWTQSTVLASTPETINRIGLLVQGNQITLLANEQILTQTSDPALTSGQIGLVGATGDDGGLALAFDNVDLWTVTNVPAPAITPVSTPLAVVSPTAIDVNPQLAAIRHEEPVFSDEFRRAGSGWDTWQTEGYSISYTNQSLLFAIDTPQWLSWSFNPQLKTPAADFLLEVDTQQLAGPNDQGFGLLFRFVDGQNYYRFLVTQTGYFTVQKFVAGIGTDLMPWTQTSALNLAAESTNRLALLVDGSQITLLINEQVVGQIADAVLLDEATSGAIGLTVSSSDTPGVHVAFDNLDFWPLP